MEISGQEINTYKPFYNYINIDLYLYVKSSHYVLFKTRVGVYRMRGAAERFISDKTLLLVF
jgi:hypothetical protein